jgi:transcriptional regulator with XRE-family HTH domain
MKKLDIKRALAEHNMSQIELAKKSGIIAPNISAIIKGGNPTVAKLMQIAEGIGCDITDLFYPDPTEEAEEKKEDSCSIMKELQDVVRKAYPSIDTESVKEMVKMIGEKGIKMGATDMEKLEEARKKHEGETLNAEIRGALPEGFICKDVRFISKTPGEQGYLFYENGLASEKQQQMTQTSTFCPHCGKKVRVGVVLLPEE